MKLERVSEPSMFGSTIGHASTHVRLAQHEEDTLRRAVRIREKARELIEEDMGQSFSYSPLYTLTIDGLLEGVASWEDWEKEPV